MIMTGELKIRYRHRFQSNTEANFRIVFAQIMHTSTLGKYLNNTLSLHIIITPSKILPYTSG